MTRMAFIRHGITAWNKAGRAQGKSDIPLDSEGILQAEKLAHHLKDDNWDMIFSSDLKRAIQTAEAIQHQLSPIPLQTDARLREVDGGEIEGTTLEERVAEWGHAWRDLDLGMETNEKVLQRAFSFLYDMIERHEGQNILVVSHGSFIKRLLRKLFPDMNMDVSLGNCSLTIIKNENGRWELEVHNCTQHLRQINEPVE
ncbi:MAG TPA: histidine phosphatase family protein [Bacillota bacterium]|nr:histidine phosphatase family protein [Bacillota bacterium]